MPVTLMLKAGPIKQRPGLALQDVTTKTGVQTKRWERTQKDAPAEDKPAAKPADVGESVSFASGTGHIEGKVVAGGKDGVTVRDSAGNQHKVRHDNVQRAGGAPGASESAKPATAARAPVNVLLKRSPKAATASEPASKDAGSAPPAAVDESAIVNPIDRAAPPAEKAKALQALSQQNEPIVAAFLKKIDDEFGTKSKSSFKDLNKIESKSKRPSVRARKPWYDVEHIRDSFRFKTVLNSFDELPSILKQMSDQGWQLVKADVDKVLSPMEWGWRIAAFDLRMPNGQLVEYYLPVKEMEDAKKNGNHQLFEDWRERDQSTFGPDDWRQYEAALTESRARYQKAWDGALTRTGQGESAVRAALTKAATAFGSSTGRNSSFNSSGEKEPAPH